MHSPVTKLLTELVCIDSRSPGRLGDPRPANAPTEEPLARFLAARLERLGLAAELQWVEPERPHLIARTPHIPGAPTLAFEAHLDTVGTEGMTIPPFTPEIRGGRLYGRGACDTKGPMAAMLTALERLLHENAQHETRDTKHSPLNLIFLGCCAEETGCEGVARLDFGGRPPDAVIVGEPTENRPVVGHKAHLWFELTVRGKAAHGSHPEAGDNAIYRMAAVIASLRRFTESRLNRDTARENAKLKIPFTPATLSVGTIRGGTKVNIVPDACAILVDVRLLPWQVPAAMLEELADWVRADSGQL
jgi:acetylornithine deacetylase/succinyl-diaminopimelate desuccinylase-like protein